MFAAENYGEVEEGFIKLGAKHEHFKKCQVIQEIRVILGQG